MFYQGTSLSAQAKKACAFLIPVIYATSIAETQKVYYNK